MKASPYNHFIELEDGRTVLAFNCYSGSVAEIERENYARVRQLLDDPTLCKTAADSEFLQCLREGGFLIPDSVDQTATLKVKSRASRREESLLTLTIAPTLACNFSCDYCFESRSREIMTEETQEALYQFTDRQLVRAQALRISWFGGEPTLCFRLIDKMQSRLLEIARKHHAEIVPGQIITNGYLLDEAMARRLKELQIDLAQITIDGPREVHDSRRKLVNGKGTFDRIMENLCSVVGILNINVRINVDKDNVESATSVAEILRDKGLLDKVRITFAQVRSTGHTCSDIRDGCYDTEEFARTVIQIQHRLFAKGIRKVNAPRIGTGGYCGAIDEGNYVVSPTGYLFRCWEDLSMDAAKSIGSLFSTEPTEQQKKNAEAYRRWDPFRMSECHNCSVLPICFGGCPLSTLHNPEATRGDCATWKYNLGDVIKLAYQAQMEASADGSSQS